MKLQDIKREIRRAMNIEELNPMQSAVASSDARRLVLIAPTGSGKTLAFAVAILKRVGNYETRESPRAIVIAPSRDDAFSSVIRNGTTPPGAIVF